MITPSHRTAAGETLPTSGGAIPGRPARMRARRRAHRRRRRPYEQRKLWLLNASHSLLAYAGSIRGHATIDEAIADPDCRSWVEAYWAEASRYVTLPADSVNEYKAALIERFSNQRVRHQLSQIAPDGSIKLPVRILPTLLAEREAGRLPVGCATVLGAWVLHLRGRGAPVKDPGGEQARAAATAHEDLPSATAAVLDTLHPGLSQDSDLVRLVVERATLVSEAR